VIGYYHFFSTHQSFFWQAAKISILFNVIHISL
jgi:hypothetical protein